MNSNDNDHNQQHTRSSYGQTNNDDDAASPTNRIAIKPRVHTQKTTMVVKVNDGVYDRVAAFAAASTSPVSDKPQPENPAAPTVQSKCPPPSAPANSASSQPQSANSSSSQLPFREFCGNAKRITVESNCQHLRIVGNDNRIFVHRNAGRLEVLGNGNRVRVLEQRRAARITYVGNGGRVYVAVAVADSEAVDVRYTGVNGAVRLVSREELLRKSRSSQPAEHERTDETPAASSSSSSLTSNDDASTKKQQHSVARSEVPPTNLHRRVPATVSTDMCETPTTTTSTLERRKCRRESRMLVSCVTAGQSLGNLIDIDGLSATIRRATKSELQLKGDL